MIIGEIQEICTYPVKSFAGQNLNSSKVEKYGLFGDRSHALVDDSQQGWDRFITARNIPSMLGYQAEFVDESIGPDFPQLRITTPEGKILNWDDQLVSEFRKYTDRKITLERHSLNSSDLLCVDDASILMISQSSLTSLEKEWDKSLDKRRFRANLVVSLHEDIPYIETEWVNRLIHVGTVTLKVDSPCKRCTMIILDPNNLNKDHSLLNLLHRSTNLMFGMYTSVVKTGNISVGDPIILE